ncbi:MAG: TetR/AcrR family transcriptional regulator [Pseudomonadota bacterium]|nr:TetR/AcrR family transcriptional regulator [Pseudomonadota bacterium]
MALQAQRSESASRTAHEILDKAIPLFARAGYSGVSMRNIAGAVGITQAALYHHYPDKENLYLAAMAHAFADKAAGITAALQSDGTAMERFERFIVSFTQLMASDPDFRALLQRELLDGDETRLELLAEQVFVEPFRAMTGLARDLAPDCDPHLLAISMAGLVLFHFETAPIRRFLPGGAKRHNDPKVVAKHVLRLLGGALRTT